MKNVTRKVGKRFLTFLLAFVLASSLAIPASMADNENAGTEDEEAVVDVDTEEAGTEVPDEDDTVVIDGENFVVEEDSGDPTMDNEVVVLNADDVMPIDDDEELSDVYVASLGIQDMTDGTAPFDDDAEETHDGDGNVLSWTAGDDANAHNGIVRTFDYVNYTLTYTTALTDPSVSVDSGTLYAEFVMDVSPEVALFNLDTMVWMNDAVVTYTFKDGTEKTSYTTEEAGNIVKQTLTGSYDLENTGGSVKIPGSSTLSAGLYIGAAANGDTVQPTFSLWMDENNGGHDAATETSEDLTISCAPKYALQIKRNSNVNRLGDYNLTTGTSDASKDPVSEEVYGRLEGFGVTFMQENDTEEKGVKGLYFPSGAVTFDINLSEALTASDGSNITGADSGWTPILWDYTENSSVHSTNSTQTGHWGRILYDYSWSSAAPANKQGEITNNVVYCSCYDGGIWTIVQDGENPLVYHVTIKDYTIDKENYRFPTLDIGTGAAPTADGTTYKANQACISAGYIQCILQFPKDSSEIKEDTSIYMDVLANNFAVGDTLYEEVTAEYGNSYAVFPSGSFNGGVWFGETGNSTQGASTVLGTGYLAGDAFSYRGNDIRLNHRCNYTADDQFEEQTLLGFTKWDADAVDVTGHVASVSTSSAKANSSEFYYVGRTKNWADEEEMSNTLINNESLHFFDSIDALKNAGYVCVGGVWLVHGTLEGHGSCFMQAGWYLTVKDTAEIGKVYAAVGEEWLSNDYKELLTKKTETSSEYTIDTNKLLQYSYYSAYCRSDTYKTMNKNNSSDRSYIKSVYDQNGNVTSGTNVTAYHAGTSLLICGEDSYVGISLDKDIYNMDNGERLAVVTVQPSVEVAGTSVPDTGETTTTTVTITVELPSDLSYSQGTAMWGDTYITPTVTKNDDESSTLTFVLENVVVGSTDLDAVTFECEIGHAGEADDVTNNQSIELTATISSTNDNKTKDARYGNKSTASMQIIRLSAVGVSKMTSDPLIELNGDFTWSLLIYNNADSAITNAHVADVFPYNGDALDSDFSGGFTVNKMTFDFSKAEASYDEDLSSMQLAIATSPVKETSEELVTDGESYPADWVKIHTSDSGVKVDSTNHLVTFDIQEILKDPDYEGSDVYGFYLILGNLEASESFNITIDVSTYGNNPGDVYNNIFDEDAEGQASAVASIEVTTRVVERDLSGLTWYDANRDGIRQEDEKLLSDVDVTLYRTDPSGFSQSKNPVRRVRTEEGTGVDLYTAYDVYGVAVGGTKTLAVTTGEYEFDCLEAGTYYVVFDNLPDDYILTPQNIGNDDTIDSDAYGVYNNGVLSYAYISDLELPDLEDMDRYLYESLDNDAGFYAATIDVTVAKEWDDNNNQDGIRPDSIDVLLIGSDGKSYDATLSAATDWTYTFEDLPQFYNGAEITYSLHELSTGWYEPEVIMTETDYGYSFTITNKYIPAVVEIPVLKIWEDEDNQDGVRPEVVTVTLTGTDGTEQTAVLNEDNGWAYLFTGLPKYYNEGTQVEYSLTEATGNYYQPEIVPFLDGYGFIVTNSHTPETISIPVEKVWEDQDNQDGVRPDAITVILSGSDYSLRWLILADTNDWKGTFTDLPVYSNGEKIEYNLREENVDDYDGTVTGNAEDGYIITNSHIPYTTDVPVEKVWNDNYDELGYRPEEIEITLTGTAAGEMVYEETVAVTADDDWTYLFEDLPVYENGVEITYTVSEAPVTDYYTDIDGSMTSGFEITNTVIAPKLDKALAEDDYERKEADGSTMHEGEDTEGDGFGTWDDADNNQEVTFHLTLSDIKGAVNLSLHDYLESQFDLELDTVEAVLYDGEDETALEYGTDYIVTEGECSDPDCIMVGCTFEVRFSDEVFQDISPEAYIVVTYKSMTDTHVDDYVDFVDQICNDAYILYGTSALMHRSAIAETETDLFGFEALKYVDEDSELVGLEGAEFTLSRSDGMYAILETETGTDGNEYYLVTGWTDDVGYAGILVSGADGMFFVYGLDDDTYTLTEIAAPVGYYELDEPVTFTLTEEGTLTDCSSLLTIENVTVVGIGNDKILTSVTGTKIWDDSDNHDGLRPEEITVRLYADGEEVDSTTVTAADDWTYTFEDLIAYNDDGQEIVYTVSEDEVDGYTTTYDGYDIVNTHESEKISVSVTKVWDDEDNADGIRPSRITVILTADGQMTGYYLVLNEDSGWTGTFENLDKYADGQLIQYDIYEPTVDGYESTLTGNSDDGFILTNTHTVDKNEPNPDDGNPNGGNGGNGGNDGNDGNNGNNGNNGNDGNNGSGTTGNGGSGTTGNGGSGTSGNGGSGTSGNSGSGTTGTGTVKTGEIIGMSAVGIAALAAIIGIVVALATRKRRENEERFARRLRK